MRFLDEKRGHHPYSTRQADKPHVFVFTVDMIPSDVHTANSSVASALRRPNWDALETDSVSFRNAFAVSPLCGPSRAALFTGRYPYIFVNEERAHDGTEVELRPDDPIYPDYLRAVGYLAGHVGKSHIGTHAFNRVFGESCSPWNRWAPPIYDDPEYHGYLKRLGIDGLRFNRRITGLKTDRRTPGNLYGGWLEQSNGSPFPIEGTYTHYLVDRALDLLDSLRERADADTPLYLHIDLFAPHQPFMIPAGLEAREKALRNETSLPAGYTRWLERGCRPQGPEPRIYETYRRNWGLYDRETARDYQIANLLQVEVIDQALGRFIERLKELGLYEDSVIVFTADHGELNLEQGLIDKGAYGHPKAARIPLLLKCPGRRGAGRCVEEDVSLLDLAPTFLAAAGVQPVARLDGVSLWPAAAGREVQRDDPFVFESGWHVAPNPAIAIHGHVDGTHWRYVYNAASDVDELYDLADPEYRNRIDDDEAAEARVTMRRRMSVIVNADPRWRCYRQCFELDTVDDLPVKQGDAQMFIPE